MANPVWVQQIRTTAARYGVDPRAALAVASAEGLGGGVGDQGTSFGPFQLHVGGALPRGRGRAWAESPEGIDYALRQIAAVAKGLRGRAAVEAIVRGFERPADPTGEIARAMGSYGTFPGAPPAPAAGPMLPPAAMPEPPPVARLSQQQLNMVNQSILHAAGGGQVDGLNLPQFRQPLKQVAPLPQGRPAPAHQLTPPTQTGHNLAQIATAQLGQPYVWGGESRKEGGFDCSGLVDWAMRQQGYTGPRLTTTNIARLGVSVKGEPLHPGDLILVNHGDHVVIYAGGDRVIAAPHRGAVVEYQPMSYFSGSITDVRRV